jgi:hypothetical protein
VAAGILPDGDLASATAGRHMGGEGGPVKGLKTLVIGAAVAALAITALGAPVGASSHKTKLAIVNGNPGNTVDVCVNGKEIKSGLKYGKSVTRTTNTPKAKIKLFKPDRRKCGGKRLAVRTIGLADATVVFTRQFPNKIVVFDNALLALPLSNGIQARQSYRHAADVGAVTFEREARIVKPVPIFLAADAALKGQQFNVSSTTGGVTVFVMVTKGGIRIVRSFVRLLEPATRLEAILVGTGPWNTRWVFIQRNATPIAP